MAVRALSLCSGAGGLDLALRDACRVVAYVEHEATAAAVLVARIADGTLDDAPVWDDLDTFPAGRFHGCVDIVFGGIPCQPHSVAGKRLADADDRDLWPATARIVRECRPEWVFIENVGGMLVYLFHRVMPELQEMGYRVEAALVKASDVGAPHARERLFVLAHSDAVEHAESQPEREPHDGIHAEPQGGDARTQPRSGRRVVAHAGHSAGSAERRLEQEEQPAGAGERGEGMAHASEPRRTGAEVARAGGGGEGENGRGRGEPQRGGAGMEYAVSGGLARFHDGATGQEQAGRRTATGAGERVADAGGGQLPVAGRVTQGRTRPRPAGAVVGDAKREGRGQVALPGAGARPAGEPEWRGGRFPPGPGDLDAWRAVLRERPDLAPAHSRWDRMVMALQQASSEELEEAFGAAGDGDTPQVGQGWGNRRARREAAKVGADSSGSPPVGPPRLSPEAQRIIRDVANGLAPRLALPRAAELRLLGNGVVPAQAALAWELLMETMQ